MSSENGRIRVVTSDGLIEYVAASNDVGTSQTLAIGSAQEVYVADVAYLPDSAARRVRRLLPDGTTVAGGFVPAPLAEGAGRAVNLGHVTAMVSTPDGALVLASQSFDGHTSLLRVDPPLS